MTRRAGDAIEWAWMAVQVAASGVQVKVAACWSVRVGGLLVSLTACVSMGGILMRSPPVTKWMGEVLSAKRMSIFQEVPAASRQRIVGGVMPGGKIEPDVYKRQVEAVAENIESLVGFSSQFVGKGEIDALGGSALGLDAGLVEQVDDRDVVGVVDEVGRERIKCSGCLLYTSSGYFNDRV